MRLAIERPAWFRRPHSMTGAARSRHRTKETSDADATSHRSGGPFRAGPYKRPGAKKRPDEVPGQEVESEDALGGIEPGHQSGISTVSMTCITPLLADTSALTTFAPLTVTPLAAAMDNSPPSTVVTESSFATSDAITRPGTTW
jgi:hypothetical protein